MSLFTQPANSLFTTQVSAAQELFSVSSSSSSISKSTTAEASRDSFEALQNMKQAFSENIRRSKIKSIINSKRIRQFHKESITPQNQVIERSKEQLVRFAEAQSSNSIVAMTEVVRSLKELSHEPICQDLIIEAAITPSIVRLLECESIQGEVCWILSNLICNPAFQIEVDICSSLVKLLIHIVSTNKIDLITAVFWCLSNLAGDEKYARIILSSNVCAAMQSLVGTPSINRDIIYQMTYTIKNMTQNLPEDTLPQSVLEIGEVMYTFFEIRDEEILINLIESATSIAKFFSRVPIEYFNNAHIMIKLLDRIQEVMILNNVAFVDSILEFSQHFFLLKADATRQGQFLNQMNPLFSSYFTSSDAYLRKKAAAIVSGILASIYPGASLDTLIHNYLRLLSSERSLEIEHSILFGILQMLLKTTDNNHEIIVSFLKHQFVQTLASILKEERNETVILLCLDILKQLMNLNRISAEFCSQAKNITETIESVGLVEIIQELQDHPSDRVYQSTNDIISEFFDFEECEGCDTEDYY